VALTNSRISNVISTYLTMKLTTLLVHKIAHHEEEEEERLKIAYKRRIKKDQTKDDR
jgi:type VI protein secretion system component Hcp